MPSNRNLFTLYDLHDHHFCLRKFSLSRLTCAAQMNHMRRSICLCSQTTFGAVCAGPLPAELSPIRNAHFNFNAIAMSVMSSTIILGRRYKWTSTADKQKMENVRKKMRRNRVNLEFRLWCIRLSAETRSDVRQLRPKINRVQPKIVMRAIVGHLLRPMLSIDMRQTQKKVA